MLFRPVDVPLERSPAHAVKPASYSSIASKSAKTRRHLWLESGYTCHSTPIYGYQLCIESEQAPGLGRHQTSTLPPTHSETWRRRRARRR